MRKEIVGMTFTLKLTALSMIGGIVIGTLLAMMRLSSHKSISVIATTSAAASAVPSSRAR